MKENILKIKSFDFAVRIVKLYKFLKKEHNEFILSQQIVRSGTAIGALIREAEHGESMKDFIHKLNIGLKEANESKYWLDLLVATEFITKRMYDSINKDCEELLKLLTASVKTSKSRIKYLSTIN
ncbi:four helix bundle protein [Lacibacter sp. MH-610]|uniref:four helix bundle protein n=1 Tax=Lacibacter sp. MH-610 TaxID=3020883 RepID=UPI0038916CEB